MSNVDTETVEEVIEEQPQETQAEIEARAGGWVDEAEWHGNPADWKPAEQWLEKGNQGKLRQQIASLEASNSEMRANQAKFVTDLAEVSSKADKTGYDRAVSEITNQQRLAVEDRDVDEFNRLEGEKQKLTPPAPAPAPVPQGQMDPALEAAANTFAVQNPQIQYVPGMMAVAQGFEQEVMQTRPDLNGNYEGRFAAVREKLAAVYPDHFGGRPAERRRTAVSPVESGGRRTNAPRGKTTGFDSLPDEFKAQAAKDIRVGKFKDEAAYYEATKAAYPDGIPGATQ
jgi:hypothetical protein